MPALVIGGEEDEIAPPPVVRAMGALILNAQVEIVPGAGHVVPLERFFFSCYGHHRDLHSFPTRRSSDLDRWSVKDVLAHLMTCDEETVRRFRLIARGQASRIHWFESMADADRFNAQSVAGARRLGLPTLQIGRAHV